MNRWHIYYNSDSAEQFMAATGLNNQRARHWMRTNKLPYLPPQWLIDRPEWEYNVIRDVMSVVLYMNDKYGTLNFDHISGAFDELRGSKNWREDLQNNEWEGKKCVR